MKLVPRVTVPVPRRPTSIPFAFSLFLGVFSDLDHTFIMTLHAIYALAGFGEDEFIDPVLAYFTLEAVCVIRVVAGHDGFVKNGEVTDVAVVGTASANGRAIGEKEKVGVGSDLIGTFCALEAVDVEK